MADYEQAEEMYRQALQLCETVLGKESLGNFSLCPSKANA